MADGDGVVTAQRFTGIAKSTSTETSSAAGTVDTMFPVAGMLYRGFASVATNANTQALINALMGKRVKFDLGVLSSGTWSVDTADADALVNCVTIVGGIPASSEILFIYSQKGTVGDTSTSI